LSGVLPIDSGERKVGHNVSTAYYPQHRLDVLSSDKTILENMQEACGNQYQTDLRKLLGKFLFTGDDAFKEVSVLSGGEKSRLVMAKILANPPNFLLLDEPTNHLDIPSRDILIEALKEYKGTMCFISHDVHFIKRIANIVIEVENGILKVYPGDYDYYVHKKNIDEKNNRAVFEDKRINEKKTQLAKQVPVAPKKKDNMNAKRNKITKKAEETEKKIEELNKKLNDMNRLLSNPASYEKINFATIAKEQKALQQEIDELTIEWDKAVEELKQYE